MQPFNVYGKTYSADKVLAGGNRYETATKISYEGWRNGSYEVILVNGISLVDALSSTTYAKKHNAPILLTEKDNIPNDTLRELKRLNCSKVTIIGGEKAISSKVVKKLGSMNIAVNRIAGRDRFETSVKVASSIGYVDKVAIVNGINGLADAMSVAAPAARDNMAIILCDGKTIKYGKNLIESSAKNYVIGGTKVISEELKKDVSGIRLAGKNRNATNGKVLETFYKDIDIFKVYVAKDGSKRENELVDALALGPLAGKNQCPVMLVGQYLDEYQAKYLCTKESKQVIQVGGGVSKESISQIRKQLNEIYLPPTEPQVPIRINSIDVVNGEITIHLNQELKYVSSNDLKIKRKVEYYYEEIVKPLKITLCKDKATIKVKIPKDAAYYGSKNIKYSVSYNDSNVKSNTINIEDKNASRSQLIIGYIPELTKHKTLELKADKGSDDIERVRVEVNGREMYKDSTGVYFISLREGKNKITITGISRYGSNVVVNKECILDTDAPKCIIEGTMNETFNRKIDVRVICNDDDADIVLTNNDRVIQKNDKNVYEVTLREGRNIIKAEITDKAGNVTTTTEIVNFIGNVNVDYAVIDDENEIDICGFSKVIEPMLINKKIVLKSEYDGKVETLIATYKIDSLRHDRATFVLDNGKKFKDSYTYWLSGDWAKFKKPNVVARFLSLYVNRVEIRTTAVTENNKNINFALYNQYDEELIIKEEYINSLDVKIKVNGSDLKSDDYKINLDSVRIKKQLSISDKVSIEFKRDGKVIGYNEFVVGKGEESVQHSVSDITLVYAECDKQGEKVTNLRVGDRVKAQCEVIDQFGNVLEGEKGNLTWTIENGRDLVDVSEDGANGKYISNDGLNLTVKDGGKLKISITSNKGFTKVLKKDVIFRDVTKMEFEAFNSYILDEKVISYTNEGIEIGKIQGNEGSRINYKDVEIKTIKKPASSNPILSIVQGRGKDINNVYLKVKLDVEGEYTFNIILEVDGKKVELPINIVGKKREKVSRIDLGNTYENGLKPNEDFMKEVGFLNKNGEEIKVKAKDLNIEHSKLIDVNMIDENGKILDNKSEEFVSKLKFRTNKEGQYNIVVSVGEVRSELILKFEVLSSISIGKSNVEIVEGDDEIIYVPINLRNNFDSNIIIDKSTLTLSHSLSGNATIIYYKDFAGSIYKETDKIDEAKGLAIKINVKNILKPGKVGLKVSSKDLALSSSINVNIKEQRKLSSFITSTNSLEILKGGIKDVLITPKDQYGKVIKVNNSDVQLDGNSDVVTLSNVEEVVDSTGLFKGYKVNITGNKEGSTKLNVNVGSLTSQSIAIQVKDLANIPQSVELTSTKDLSKLYSTINDNVEFDFSAEVKNQNGDTISGENGKVTWAVEGNSNVKISDSGKVVIPQNFKGSVTIKAIANNEVYCLKTIRYSNDKPTVQKGTEYLINLDGSRVDLTQTIELKNNMIFKVKGIDQYGNEIFVDGFKYSIKGINRCVEVMPMEDKLILIPRDICDNATIIVPLKFSKVNLNVTVSSTPTDCSRIEKAIDDLKGLDNEIFVEKIVPSDRKDKLDLTYGLNVENIKLNFKNTKIVGTANIIADGKSWIKNGDFDVIHMSIIKTDSSVKILESEIKYLNITYKSNILNVNVSGKSRIGKITINGNPGRIEGNTIVEEKNP